MSHEETDDITDRVNQRSHRPDSDAFRSFIQEGWGGGTEVRLDRSAAADYARARRAAISAMFPGERLVIPAGGLVVRSNDTDYRYRAHSAFAHLTGLGQEHEPDAVLVLHPDDEDGPTDAPRDDERAEDGADRRPGHTAVLYMRPSGDRTSSEFYADSRYGEFWVGPRPSLDQMATHTGIETADVSGLRDALSKDLGEDPGAVRLRVVAEAAADVTAVVDDLRRSAGADPDRLRPDDDRLLEALSELRLVKDEHEVEQMRLAVDATIEGFAEVVRRLPDAVRHRRGERVVDGVFAAHARAEGNQTGYETIAAAGPNATTLHWMRNDGPVRPGELLLLDAGVEVDSLYTADITRTLPVDGTFTDVQRKVYRAVLAAADAAFEAAVPGARFRDVHAAAMVVIAQHLADWGLLPVSAEESLRPDGQYHRRWMVHGTSHHLGIDVHDCAQARRDLYLDGVLVPGMVFTIEPGLYFKADDTLVPEEYRGIGIRIEDDILMTADGPENLSAALARTPEDVEAWMAELLAR